MFDRRTWMMGVGCALALLAPSRVVGADGDQMFATERGLIWAMLNSHSAGLGVKGIGLARRSMCKVKIHLYEPDCLFQAPFPPLVQRWAVACTTPRTDDQSIRTAGE